MLQPRCNRFYIMIDKEMNLILRIGCQLTTQFAYLQLLGAIVKYYIF